MAQYHGNIKHFAKIVKGEGTKFPVCIDTSGTPVFLDTVKYGYKPISIRSFISNPCYASDANISGIKTTLVNLLLDTAVSVQRRVTILIRACQRLQSAETVKTLTRPYRTVPCGKREKEIYTVKGY